MIAKWRTKDESEDSTSSVRASISFPPDLYRTLEDIAKKKKVSLAWVVRDATEKYVAEQWPLFAGERRR
jgi:metal-responsive CopG/Arc/MetJ family transcriptional regulator